MKKTLAALLFALAVPAISEAAIEIQQPLSSSTDGVSISSITSSTNTWTANQEFDAQVLVDGDLTVTSSSTFSSDIGVTGNIGLTGNITQTGDQNVTGAVTATSFSGDGSALTGLGTPLSSPATFSWDLGGYGLLNVSSITTTGDSTYVSTNTQVTFTVNGSNPLVLYTSTIVATGLYCREDVQLYAVQYATDAAAVTVSTSPEFGNPQFTDDDDKTMNYVRYEYHVPFDIDTSTDIVGTFVFKLGGADTSSHTYVVSMTTIANSGTYPTEARIGTNEVTLYHIADASGAEDDRESVTGTLTSYGATATAGSTMIIDVARDGDDAQDVSTVDSYGRYLLLNVRRLLTYTK